MARVVLGSLLGGGAATAYLRPDIVADYAKDQALQGILSSRSQASSVGNSREFEQLTKTVEQLANYVYSSKNSVTVVHTDSNRKSSTLVTVVAVTGLGVVVYLRVVKGWSLSDLMYVTRRSLKQGLLQVSKGLDDVRGRLEQMKEAVQGKLQVLMRKQDATIAAQKQMHNRLNDVGDDVDTIRSHVGQIHGLVLDVRSGLSEVCASQRLANQGIHILCRAVSELMQGHSIPSKKELIEFTQHPIWSIDKPQGLEGLLCDVGNSDAEQRRGSGAALLGDRCGASRGARTSALDPILDAGNRPSHAQHTFSDGGDSSSSFDFPAAGMAVHTCGRSAEPAGSSHGQGSAWHRAGHGVILTGTEALRSAPAVSTVGNSPW